MQDFNRKRDVSAMKEVFQTHTMVYIYPEKPTIYQYFQSYLLKTEVTRNTILISRRIAESREPLKIWVSALFFDFTDELVGNIRIDRWMDQLSCMDRRSEAYQTAIIDIPVLEYSYAVISIHNNNYDREYMLGNTSLLTQLGNASEDKYLRCIGGMVRVNIKVLASQCHYFKNLFEEDREDYEIDIAFFDMMEVLFTMNPINRPIKNGLTYGACYRVSQQLKWVELADKCLDYIENIRRINPLEASFIAYEGGVEEDAKLYLELKDQEGVNLREEFERQPLPVDTVFDELSIIELKKRERIL